MKKITPLLVFLTLFFLNCNSQNKQNKVVSAASKYNYKTEKVELTERTRGYYRNITITPKTEEITIREEKKTTQTGTKNWTEITKAINTIDVKTISKLESPSNKRTYDAALMSLLVITINGVPYTSAGFDAGNPPKELKPIYDLLYSKFNLKETN